MIDLDFTTVTMDEFDEPAYAPICRDCDCFVGCDIEGHEDVGYCSDYREFVLANQDDCRA